MKSTSNLKWKLGAFVIVALGILIFFIFFIGKNKNIFSSTITLNSFFEDVSGLAVGNNVRLSGIKVGTVTEIVIVNDSLVKVSVIVEESAKKYIRVDSKMTISSDGLMGDKVINLLKGTPDTTLVTDNAILPSTKPFDTGKLLASLQRTASHAEVIAGNLASISRKVNSNDGTIGRLLGDKEFANHISHTMKNLDNASGGLAENMEAAKHSFLFKRYFKKKEKEEQKSEEDGEKEKSRKERKKEKEQEKEEQRQEKEQQKEEGK